MDYFTILELNKEPFSNSPDPEFFFHSRRHLDCLQKLELAVLLRRGLNVIIGDVGTGKTTMCRQLIRRFSQKDAAETHLILDPYFLNASEFLAAVTRMFTGNQLPAGSPYWQAKEVIKQHLFTKGVAENKTVVLIIDEGQKIPAFCLEILREFLNFETNEFKLLQIVIFAQKEFAGTIRKYPNFADRINLYHQLKPLSFRDTRLMIRYRLEKSGNSAQKLHLFTYRALWAVYRLTGGYPRKIINLCHQSILSMIIQNRSEVGYFLVSACARRVFPEQAQKRRRIRTAAAVAGVIAAVLLIFRPSDPLRFLQSREIRSLKTLLFEQRSRLIGSPVSRPTSQTTYRTEITVSDLSRLNPGRSDPKLPLTQNPPLQTEASIREKTINTSEQADTSSASPARPAPMAAQPTAGAQRPEKFEEPGPASASTAKAPGTGRADLTSKFGYWPILGQLTLQRNETLSRIIRLVYGGYSPRYFKSFILANPHIEDPDRVEVGQIISLPAIPARVDPPQTPVWWVKVDEKDSLEAAFNILRRLSDSLPAVSLIPHWNPTDGTKFALILSKAFRDERTAHSAMQKIAAGIPSNPKIMSFWEKGTVYFADPYLNLKN